MSGWKMNRSAGSTLLPILLLLATALFADDRIGQENAEIPDIELLEFLGSWQTPDGDFLDPLILAGETTSRENPTENDDE